MYWGLGVFLVAIFCPSDVLSQTSKYVGQVTVQNPGLLNMFSHTSNNVRQRHSLLISTYSTSVNSYDATIALQYPGEAMATNFSGYTGKNLYNFLYWPKEVRQVPREVFGHDAVGHFDGSTILGKGVGSIYVSDLKDFLFPATHDIGKPLIPATTTFMYSSGLWKRVDNNNRLDLMTCRASLDSGILRYGQLVWLEHPLGGLTGSWSINVLKEMGCDTNLAEAIIRLGNNNHEVVFTTGLHTKRLTFFYTTGTLNRWDNPSNIGAGVIEQAGREFYDVTTADVNNDGNVDVLVTVVAQNGGSVEVFEVPADFRNDNQYVRRVLADGFVARAGGANGRSPGVARPFYPTSDRSGKPWIMVSGADDGRAYYLRPTSSDPASWAYERVTVFDYGANQVVPGISSADIDADGYEELFVSARTANKVDVFSFRP